MSAKKHGLGTGVGALFGGDYSYDLDGILKPKENDEGQDKILQLDITFIQPNPSQPRKNFDSESIAELSESIKEHGIIQPLVVEKITERKYSIIAGERRYRAAKMAGLKTVPVILKTYDELERLQVSLIENIQRENLGAVEEAKAFKYLLTEKGLTQEELSKKIGKSRSVIANSVRLLNLSSKMQDALEAGQITTGHAKAILSVLNPAEQDILFNKIVKESLSVRQAEKLASALNSGKRIAVENGASKEKIKRNEELVEVESRFLSAMGTKVTIKGSLTKGKLEITFKDAEELERIYQLIEPNKTLFGDEWDEEDEDEEEENE